MQSCGTLQETVYIEIHKKNKKNIDLPNFCKFTIKL